LRNFGARSRMQQPEDGGKTRAARRLELKSIKDSVKYRIQENDQLKKKTAVDKLAAKFDLERIGLTTALNQATDEETKLRLRAQVAILDNDEALAKKILAEMNAAEATKKMADSMSQSAAALEAAFRATIARLAIYDPVRAFGSAGAGPGGSTVIDSFMPPATTPYDPLSSLTVTPQDLTDTNFTYNPLSGLRPTEQDIRITIDTAQSGDKFAQLIAESIQVADRSGYNTSANGSLPV
jgi:hypothetical protein